MPVGLVQSSRVAPFSGVSNVGSWRTSSQEGSEILSQVLTPAQSEEETDRLHMEACPPRPLRLVMSDEDREVGGAPNTRSLLTRYSCLKGYVFVNSC